MPWKNALIICLGLILFAVVIAPIMDQPAEAQNNNDRHAAAVCPHCTASPFPVTDEPEVARVYATAYLVALYMEQKPTLSSDFYVKFAEDINKALD